MLSPKAFAEMHGVAYTTVMFWLKNELIAGVEKESLPFGKDRFVYQIPADSPKPSLTPGPKKKVEDDGEASTATTAPDDDKSLAGVGKKSAKKIAPNK